MKEIFNKIRKFFANRWTKFTLVSIVYILWLVVWSRSPWMLLGLPIIFDIYITKYLQRLILGKNHQQRRATNKAYRETVSWIEAIVFAIVAASLIHIYVFQMYRIPSSSMEKTLMVGDYLCVSKAAYGPRMPMTPIALPLVHNSMPFAPMKKSYSEAVKLPYKRLAGRGSVQRDDIVVFNFPAGDTAVMGQSISYYDILSSLQDTYGKQQGREIMNRQFNVTYHPVDKREHYVKRCVGLPGDTIEIIHTQLFVNGQQHNDAIESQYNYTVRTNGTPFNRKTFEELDIANDEIFYDRNSTYMMPLTREKADIISQMPNVVGVERYEVTEGSTAIFPNDSSYDWTQDNFGPLWVPKRGTTVVLTHENLPLYARIIKNYEGNSLETDAAGNILVNGVPTENYTFQMDYYFMMGDNRHNSADSRFWGFVPEDHIVGKPVLIGWSTNKDKSFPKKIRFNRIFSVPK